MRTASASVFTARVTSLRIAHSAEQRGEYRFFDISQQFKATHRSSTRRSDARKYQPGDQSVGSPPTSDWGFKIKAPPLDHAKNPLTALNIHPTNYVQSGDSTISKAFGRLLRAAADKKLQPHKNTSARVQRKRSAEPLLKLFVTLRGPSGNTRRARCQVSVEPQSGPVINSSINSTKLTFSCLSSSPLCNFGEAVILFPKIIRQ